jgi:CHAT domain-containing protein
VALRDAQRALRARPSWSHPFYWAAFVLWGDAGPLPAGLVKENTA